MHYISQFLPKPIIYLVALSYNLVFMYFFFVRSIILSGLTWFKQLLFNNIYLCKFLRKINHIKLGLEDIFNYYFDSVLHIINKHNLKQLATNPKNEKNDTISGYCSINQHNDQQFLRLIESIDLIFKWISNWPQSVHFVIKHVKFSLTIKAEHAAEILNHCHQTRASLSSCNQSNFFDFRPIYISTVNQEFELNNQIIQDCEKLLTTEFVQPLQERVKKFKKDLLIVKEEWKKRINMMLNILNELRRYQKNYLRCALHFVKMLHNSNVCESDVNHEIQFKREQLIRNLLIKSETEYKLKINETNRCIFALEQFKTACLNELQCLIDESSREVRRLTINYIIKLYPNQKSTLFKQLVSIVPEVDFRNFVNELNIPPFPTYSFVAYDSNKT